MLSALSLHHELVLQPPCAATRAVAELTVGDGVVQVEEALGIWVAHRWRRWLVPRWLCTAPVFRGPRHLAGVRSKLGVKPALHCVRKLGSTSFTGPLQRRQKALPTRPPRATECAAEG